MPPLWINILSAVLEEELIPMLPAFPPWRWGSPEGTDHLSSHIVAVDPETLEEWTLSHDVVNRASQGPDICRLTDTGVGKYHFWWAQQKRCM